MLDRTKSFAGLDGETIDWPKLIGAVVISIGALNLLAELGFAMAHALGLIEERLWGLQQAAIGSGIIMGVGALLYAGELAAVFRARFGAEEEEA